MYENAVRTDMTMDFLRVAFRRVKALFSGEILDRDMDKEMRVHLDLLVEEYERAGMGYLFTLSLLASLGSSRVSL